MLNKKKNNKGFTLVELLVVIAIIGILAVVAVPALFKNINKAKVADVEADYNAIKSASLSYYADKSLMPTQISDIQGYLDSELKTPTLGGSYTVGEKTIDNKTKLVLTITGAKATGEQMLKLSQDLGAKKVYLETTEVTQSTPNNGKEINLVLIDNTDMGTTGN